MIVARCIALLGAMIVIAGAARQNLSAPPVVERTVRYAMVAEERQRQSIVRADGRVRQTRTLRSDFLLIKYRKTSRGRSMIGRVPWAWRRTRAKVQHRPGTRLGAERNAGRRPRNRRPGIALEQQWQIGDRANRGILPCDGREAARGIHLRADRTGAKWQRTKRRG